MPVEHPARQKSGDIVESQADKDASGVLMIVALAHQEDGLIVAEEPTCKAR